MNRPPARRAAAFATAGLLLALGAAPTSLAAQASPVRPQPGDRVRVAQGPWIPEAWRRPGEDWLEGRFQGWVRDTLVLRVRAERLHLSSRIPGDIEVARVAGHHAKTGALVGAAVGFGIGGAIVGLERGDGVVLEGRRNDRFLDDGEVGTLVLGTVAGAGVGALVGRALARVEWLPLDRRSGRGMALRMGAGGRIGVGVRVPSGGG